MRKPRERPKEMRTGLKALPHREITYAQWTMRGQQLYGRDRTKWQFRCYGCGHVQSIAEALKHPPHGEELAKLYTPDKMQRWIFFSCEGRWRDDMGCDWSLGGMLSGSRTTVKMPDGKGFATFEFAADPIERDYHYLPQEFVLPMTAATT